MTMKIVSASVAGFLITVGLLLDDIVVNAEEEKEVDILVDRVDTTTTRYRMEEIRDDKTKSPEGFQRGIRARNSEQLQVPEINHL